MSGLINTLNDLYIRFLVWLGAEPPSGYEHLIGGQPGPREYTLVEGDTLFSVARRFGVHYERIAKANDIESPQALKPGQIVFIPPADWVPADGSLPPETPAPPAEPAPEAHGEEAEPPPAEAVSPPPDLASREPLPMPPFEEAGVPEENRPAPEIATTVEALAERLSTTSEADQFDFSEPVSATQEAPPVEDEMIVRPPHLPAGEAPPGEAAETEMLFRYEVQRGDTLSAIARRYNLTVKELVEANEIADPNRLFPGQKLIIPGYMPRPPQPEPQLEPPLAQPIPEPGEFFMHIVAVGDTLSGIAKRYGVTVRQLVEVNDVEDPTMIRIGQRLVIPQVVQPPVPEAKPLQPLAGTDPRFPPLGPDDAVRALYVSYFAIGHVDFRQRIFDLLDNTELNAVVIDAKGDYGWISYPTNIPLAREIGAARPTAKDFESVMAQFKERGVYTIARIVTFKDSPLAKAYPEFAVKLENNAEIWQDREGLAWTDPFLKSVWDYNIQVAVEAAQQGFDEIQFDYLRFPTQSQAGGIPRFSQEITKEARVSTVTGFLSVAQGQLKPLDVKLAADTFGYTCWRKDDTLIGQDIDRMAQYLDVLCPMLYPSTFGSGIPGYKFAIAYPYEVVYESARRAVERVSYLGTAVRPWIQDFPDYRFDRRAYGRDEIQAQIKACFDAGCTGFMVWDPRVKYTDGAYAPVVNGSA